MKRFVYQVPFVCLTWEITLAAVRRVTEASLRRVPTAELNRWLADTVRRHDPGMARKGGQTRPLKFLYASQVGVQPPRFVIFCTDPDSVLVAYRRYLENRLRDSFGFEGCPIRVHLRGRKASME